MNFHEAHFRRQVPIRSFFADFASHRWRLVVECDGGHHATAADETRTHLIEAEGYRVLRFWNHEILGNADGVATTIAAHCPTVHPHPNPPPSRGRESEERRCVSSRI